MKIFIVISERDNQRQVRSFYRENSARRWYKKHRPFKEGWNNAVYETGVRGIPIGKHPEDHLLQ